MAVHRSHADARGVGETAHRKRRHPVLLRDLIRVLQQFFPGNNALSHKAPLAIEPSPLQTGWVLGTMVTRFRKTLRLRYLFDRGGRALRGRSTMCPESGGGRRGAMGHKTETQTVNATSPSVRPRVRTRNGRARKASRPFRGNPARSAGGKATSRSRSASWAWHLPR